MLITMTLNGKKVADDVAADTLLINIRSYPLSLEILSFQYTTFILPQNLYNAVVNIKYNEKKRVVGKAICSKYLA